MRLAYEVKPLVVAYRCLTIAVVGDPTECAQG